MSDRRVLILGAGYSGQAFARRKPEGVAISGTTRDPGKFARLRLAGIEPLAWAGGRPAPELRAELARTTHLVVSAAPGEKGDPALQGLAAALEAAPALRWVGYLSTVGVYGDHGGAWVDEASPCRPRSGRSVARAEAEQAWLAFGAARDLPVAVLRLSGIYGSGRNAFVNLEQGTAKRLVKPGQVFNRIHADDIAGALWHLSGREEGGVFNVSDDEPAAPQDVVSFAAGLMGVEPPPEQPFDAAALTPMQRSFYGENKRVANGKLKATGYRFAFPDYRSALRKMWATGDWREGERRSTIKP